jgi:hypothetical protein
VLFASTAGFTEPGRARRAGGRRVLLPHFQFNWHGGGGFIGNRYFVNALPAVLFLVTRIAPAWLPVVGFALGGIFVGPILFTPFGAPVPYPTLQAHVRNSPFRFFPFERTLARQIPGYRGQVGNGVYFFGRRDVLNSVGESLWAVGGKPVEIWVQTDRPLARPVFEVESAIAPNRVAVTLGGDRKVIHFDSAKAPGNTTGVTLAPGPPPRCGPTTAPPTSLMWIDACPEPSVPRSSGETADRRRRRSPRSRVPRPDGSSTRSPSWSAPR